MINIINKSINPLCRNIQNMTRGPIILQETAKLYILLNLHFIHSQASQAMSLQSITMSSSSLLSWAHPLLPFGNSFLSLFFFLSVLQCLHLPFENPLFLVFSNLLNVIMYVSPNAQLCIWFNVFFIMRFFIDEKFQWIFVSESSFLFWLMLLDVLSLLIECFKTCFLANVFGFVCMDHPFLCNMFVTITNQCVCFYGFCLKNFSN